MKSKPVVLTDGTSGGSIQADFGALLEKCHLTDMVALVGLKHQKEFQVHKAILAARSPVFEAMFASDLEEAKQNRVEITDIEPEVFELLLRYIYSDRVPQESDYALELCIAADKVSVSIVIWCQIPNLTISLTQYQLVQLKAACELLLLESISLESVSSVLLFADLYSANQLKTACIDYFTAHSKEVMATEGWAGVKAKPELVLEVLYKLADKCQPTTITTTTTGLAKGSGSSFKELE